MLFEFLEVEFHSKNRVTIELLDFKRFFDYTPKKCSKDYVKIIFLITMFFVKLNYTEIVVEIAVVKFHDLLGILYKKNIQVITIILH